MTLTPSGSYRKTRGIIRRGARANQPNGNEVLAGTLYFVTDELVLERSNGVGWDSYSISGTFLADDGTASAPSFASKNWPTTGMYFGGENILRFATFGLDRITVLASGNVGIGTTTPTHLLSVGSDDGLNNNQQLGINVLTEVTTIEALASTDTTIQMPAGAIILAVSVRVTTVIPTANDFTVGDSGLADRFSTAVVSTTAGSTDRGTKAGAHYNASALSVRITPDLTPADNTGRVRVTIYYFVSTPPTS